MTTPRGTRASYRIQLLGGFAVRKGARPLAVRPSTRRLVALIGVEGAMDRADAAGRLFPDVNATRAGGNLRTILRRARVDVEGLIVEEGTALWIDADRIDFHEVREWAAKALEPGDSARPPVPREAGQDLLPGWSDHWLTDHREHLHLLQLYALEESSSGALSAGRFGEAAGCALRALAMDPLRETANRLIVEILLREGNVVDALRRFRHYEALLELETGTEPGVALTALIAPVVGAAARRRAQPAASYRAAPLRPRPGPSRPMAGPGPVRAAEPFGA